MASSPQLVPQLGPDGIAMEPPVIAYTEKVLEEKELELKKYIEENYSKIRNVERELAVLAFEIKLTAGPKKAALEHFRKKIELSSEKIKVAKQREEQAKKVWEAATKALKEEEESKLRLCEDLQRLVQESAAYQYSRLEELKKKLEALNPESTGALIPTAADGRGASTTPQSGNHLPKEDLKPKNSVTIESTTITTEVPGISKLVTLKENQRVSATKSQALDEEKFVNSQQGSPGEFRTRSSSNNRPANNARGRGTLVKGVLGSKANNSWTGAGFEVDDNAING